MKFRKPFDVIIVGGSYSGLAAGMALGRALRRVLIIDSGKPCNRQTPRSHNFLTQDGKTPHEIATRAKRQVERYSTVKFYNGSAYSGIQTEDGFQIQASSGDIFDAKKIIFASGIRDIIPSIHGSADCWGISVLHCPYCHGYEIRNEATGILGNGEYGFEFSALISNWTKDLTLFTNGPSTLTDEQTARLSRHGIPIVETEIATIDHKKGRIKHLVFKDGSRISLTALYVQSAFEQHCSIPQELGCEFTDEGYIRIDAMQRSSVPGVFACGDNTSRLRTVANAVSTGTTAGMMVNKEIVLEEFQG